MDTFFRPKIAVIFGRDPMSLRYRGLETNTARFMLLCALGDVDGQKAQHHERAEMGACAGC